MSKGEGKGDALVDDFLGAFADADSEDDDDDDDQKPEDEAEERLDYLMQNPRETDGPLTYGIQFIQNALKSWAQQRLQHQYMPQLQQQAQQWQQQHLQSQKRGPGRPRKFPDGEEPERTSLPSQPPPLQIRMESTSEGVAIKAFQQVLDSGCLQVNAVLPVELTSALRHLYMQIDHLINQGSKHEPEWRCMSYGAQIAANKTRVDKWKDSQAKAQEEIARQQHFTQQQVMQQMGLPMNQPGPLTTAQAQHAHAVELERRRSAQHAAQQPYLSQHHLNPLALGSQPGTPSGTAPSPSPANVPQSGSPAPGPNGTPNGFPNQSSPVNGGNQQHMTNVKMYMPGYLPRTGTQMKFSFAPHSEQALKMFGPQSFPTGSPQGPNIPNRGPMSAVPSQAPQSPANDPNSAAASPVVRPSIKTAAGQTNGEAHQANGQVVDDVEVIASNGTKDVEMVEATPIPLKKETQTPALIQTGGFTAVNAPKRPAVPTGSPDAAISSGQTADPSASSALGKSTTTVSKMNGQGSSTDLASRFPHPGAVVLDQ